MDVCFFFDYLTLSNMSENHEETVGIMKLKPGKLSTHVIVVGDPKRVDEFSVHLEVRILISVLTLNLD